LPTTAGSTPGFTSTVISNKLIRSKGWMLAETPTASFSCFTKMLSSRELARPPSTLANMSSGTSSGFVNPGTTQFR
jgi:hypothetical protein